MKYVESLLVFGSKINPYKHYSSFDTFQEAKNRQPGKRKEEKRKHDVISEAPETIMQGDTLEHYEQKQYNFKPAMKELPQIMLPADLALKGIVSLDFPNLTDNDPFMPSKGGVTKNLPMIPEPKMTDEKSFNFNESNDDNFQKVKNNSNSNAATTYTPGSMITFNTFNKGSIAVYKPPENNTFSNNNQVTNNSSVNKNAPPPPNINLPATSIIVNSGAPPPPLLNLGAPKGPSGIPPPPPLINNLASLGVQQDDGNEDQNEQKQNKPSEEGGRCI